MKLKRAWIRALLGFILVAACLAAAILPALPTAQAAPDKASAISGAPGNIVISNFRFHGPKGPGDQFIEIFNRSCDAANPVDVSGWIVQSSNLSTYTTIYQFPANTTLAPGQYWLIAGPDYSGSAPPDGGYINPLVPIDENNGGVAIFPSLSVPAADAAGLGTSNDTYKEGTGLNPLTTNVNRSYVRQLSSGMYVDTNKNSRDFVIQRPSQPHSTADSDSGKCGLPSVTIAGNTGTGGAVLSYSDGGAQQVSTDSSGNYTLTVSANFSGTVTPSKPGFSFTPSSRKYTGLLSNVTGQNYTASNFNPPVMINEVAWYGTIYNYTNDWIELTNNTNQPINLDGWRLEAQDGSPNIDLKGIIPPQGFFLLVNAGNSSYATSTPTPAASPPCIVFRTADNVLVNQYFYGDVSYTGETLFLVDPSKAVVDYANRNGGAWPAGSYTNRASMERHAIVPDSDTAWYTYALTTGLTQVHDCGGNRVYGSPGYANWAVNVIATPSPVPTKYKTATPRPPTPFGHMVINEFLPRAGFDWNQDGAVDVYDEFIELKNLGPVDAQLAGWKLSVISPEGNTTYTLASTTLKTDERALFYGLKTKLSLYDSGGTVRLLNNRGIVIDARSYGPAQAPDESHCRLPDGYYWRFPCFPTPGNENSLTGTRPSPPPAIASQPPPCLMADIIPAPFREAECHSFGAEIYNPAYWDDQASFKQFPVRDVINKWRAVVE